MEQQILILISVKQVAHPWQWYCASKSEALMILVPLIPRVVDYSPIGTSMQVCLLPTLLPDNVLMKINIGYLPHTSLLTFGFGCGQWYLASHWSTYTKWRCIYKEKDLNSTGLHALHLARVLVLSRTLVVRRPEEAHLLPMLNINSSLRWLNSWHVVFIVVWDMLAVKW